MDRKFIKQNDDYSCRLITLLNAHIHKFGNSPIEYGTKEYLEYYKIVDKGKWGGISEAYDLCKAKRVPFKGKGNEFKKWFYQTIKDGNYIDFSGYCYNLHSFLVAEHNEQHDSFMVVNAGIFSKEVVEWLPLPILMKSHCYNAGSISSYKDIKFNNIVADSAAIIF